MPAHSPAILLFVTVLLFAPDAAAQARTTRDPLRTPEQLQSLYESKQYGEALRQITRALALKGTAAKPYDRHALLRLKAECYLRTGENAKAADAFATAATAAPDPRAAAEDRVCEVLAKRSKGTTFQPAAPAAPAAKSGAKSLATPAPKPPPPIDISDPADRGAAFAAVLEQTRAAAESRLQSLANPRTLDDLYQVLKATHEWRMAELAVKGEMADAKAAADRFADGAIAMMRKQLSEAAKTYARLEELAWLPGDPVPGQPEAAFTRGLLGEEINELKEVLGDCKRVVLLSEEFALQLDEIGPGHRWAELIEEAKAVEAPAEEMSQMMGGVAGPNARTKSVSRRRRR